MGHGGWTEAPQQRRSNGRRHGRVHGGDHDGGDGPIKVTEAAPFKVGDAVKVKDGPFVDFSGVVQEVSHEKQKLKVSVSIFGRATPVELDYLQVALEG